MYKNLFSANVFLNFLVYILFANCNRQINHKIVNKLYLSTRILPTLFTLRYEMSINKVMALPITCK